MLAHPCVLVTRKRRHEIQHKVRALEDSEDVTSEDAANPVRPPVHIGTSDHSEEMLFKSLSLRQKIGQLFMIGFAGTEVSTALDHAINVIKPGAVVVFARNITSARQISNLNIQAQRRSLKSSHLPLMIAVDQEGGNVLRIRTAMPLPSALALGETHNTELVERAGRETGILLRTLGFTMNLAPVLDVSDPMEKSFIGTRTFGSEPKVVSKMGTHFAKGLESAHILSTAKHFPGHGGVVEDSHRQTPEQDASKTELEHQDLVPFLGMKRHMFDRWAVMLAHVSYPALDPSGLPATFSKLIVTGLLRTKIGFQGLILTDDIEMAGASKVANVGERAIRAIEAGVDMIMVAWNRKLQAELVQAVYQAVRSGRISEERLNQSVRRIISVKHNYCKQELEQQLHIPTDTELRDAVRNPAFQEIAQEVVHSKFVRIGRTLTPDFDEFLGDKPVFVFTASERFYKSFQETLSKRKSRMYRLSENQTFNIDRVMRANPDSIGLLYLTGTQVAKIANQISDDVAKRFVVVNVETEGMIKNPDWFKLIADVYYRHPQLGGYSAQHIFNELHPLESEMRMPIEARPPKGTHKSKKSTTSPDAQAGPSNTDPAAVEDAP